MGSTRDRSTQSLDPLSAADIFAATQRDQEDQQPFFRARLFILPEASDEGQETVVGSSNPLVALKIALQSNFRQFLRDPQPEGADGYIFNRSLPTFQVAADGVLPPHIQVDCQTGSSTEDAHLLLHFLRLQQQKGQGSEGGLLRHTAIQIHTEDGELLLIEAADVLPDWIEPDNADGRVWMVNEQVCIIPPEVEKGHVAEGAMSEVGPIADYNRSLQILVDPTFTRSLLDSAATTTTISDAAFAPLTSYPTTQWIASVQHQTTVYLPSQSILHALQKDQQLISRASRAFLGREGGEIKIGYKMAKFLPNPSQGAQQDETTTGKPKAWLAPISIPRRIYAELLSQRFMPPKSFPAPYRDKVAAWWDSIDSLPRQNQHEIPSETQDLLQDGRRWDLGCKLSVGLEIAYANDRERLISQSRVQTNLHAPHPEADHSSRDADAHSSSAYEPFIDRLTKLGYFGGQVRGSAKWKELETQAVKDWWSNEKNSTTTTKEASETDQEDLQWVNEIVEDSKFIDIDQSLSIIDPSDTAKIKSSEADDTWLWDVDHSVLDGDGGQGNNTLTDLDAEKEATQRLNDFSQRVERFVQGKGDLQGVVIDERDDQDSDDEEEEEPDADEGKSGQIDEVTARTQARRQFEALSVEEREERMKTLVQGIDGSSENDVWGRGTDSKADMDLDEHLLKDIVQTDNDKGPSIEQVHTSLSKGAEAELETSKKATETSNSHNIPASDPGPKPSSQRELSPSEMRKQMASYRLSSSKSYRKDKKGPTMTSSFFSPQQFDGAESWQLDSEPDDSEEEREARKKEPKSVRRERARLLDLSESESESEDEEDEQTLKRNDEQEEMAEFLQFARKELGFTEDQLNNLLNERKSDGRWVPGADDKKAGVEAAPSKSAAPPSAAGQPFGKGFAKGFLGKRTATKNNEPLRNAPTKDEQKKSKVSFVEEEPEKPTQSSVPQTSSSIPDSTTQQPSTRSTRERDTSLSSFDTLMSALDSRLDEHRASRGLPPLDREEYYGKGVIRSEDWSSRRPGGASLGSVLNQDAKQQQQQSDNGKDQETEPKPQSTDGADEMDMDEEDYEPLTAKDPALLERLLKQQESSSFRNMIHAEMEKKFGKGAGRFAEGRGDPLSVDRPEEDVITTNDHLSARLHASTSQVVSESSPTSSGKITEIVDEKDDKQSKNRNKDEDDDDDQSYGSDIEISGPGGDDAYDPIDAEDTNEQQPHKSNKTAHSSQALPSAPPNQSMPEMLSEAMDQDESDGDDEENLPTIANEIDSEEKAEMVSNLMESWRAQGGDPGPVGLLFSGGKRGAL
ncbi:unnamed protein product [Sympodiomycopsis kandeliae]